MTKKGPLSKTEVFYISHHWRQMSVDELAKDLDRAKSVIDSCVKECQEAESQAKVGNAYGQFGIRNGSTVMTKNASQIGDDMRGFKSKPVNNNDRVTQIRRNKDE